MSRAEKLFCIRAQVQKAASQVEHGDRDGWAMTFGDALTAVLDYLEELEKAPMPAVVGPDEGDHPRAAELPQPTKIKRK